MLRFAEPWWLLALLVIPLLLWLQLHHHRERKLRLPFTRITLLRQVARENRIWRLLFPILRGLILLCLILALAQPRWGRGVRDISKMGVDIVLAIDVSGSMLAMDFAPQSRLSAAVSVAQDFIRKRPNDRFGLVAFSEYAITQSPLTFDHYAVLSQLERLEVNQEASFTAIGLGLAKSVARLKYSSAKSRIVILITDGVSNTGEIDPISAARMAGEFGIKVYPIGVGSNSYVDYPMLDPRFGSYYGKVFVELDMETLDKVAQITGTGQAANASDRVQLEDIMEKIDDLEKTKYDTRVRYIWDDQFMPLLWIAFILLVFELLLRLLVMPVFPE
jgi:Ca-activated chloride channel homolog